MISAAVWPKQNKITLKSTVILLHTTEMIFDLLLEKITSTVCNKTAMLKCLPDSNTDHYTLTFSNASQQHILEPSTHNYYKYQIRIMLVNTK